MPNDIGFPSNKKPARPEDVWVDSKSREVVQGMFTDIAPSYDVLNHVLSLNIDKRWRRLLARETITPAVTTVLDVCGGTGDLSLTLAAEARRKKISPRIICSDFTPAMTAIAKRKFNNTSSDKTTPVPLVADTICLPFGDDRFDLVTVAFGIRNVVDTTAGLREMVRVLKPGGTIAVLEFSKTRSSIIDRGFRLYFSHILPCIGRAVTGTRAYNYLSKSVEKFPEGREFQDMVSDITGTETTARRLSLGIATLYISKKKQPAKEKPHLNNHHPDGA